MARALFDSGELRSLARAVRMARELVGTHYALSNDWFDRTSHLVCSGRDLRAPEIAGPPRLAQIRRVYRLSADTAAPWVRWCPHYRICMQDHNLIGRLEPVGGVSAETLTPVVVHEYVHLVRFTRWEHPYAAVGDDEERRVDALTRRILHRHGGASFRHTVVQLWG